MIRHISYNLRSGYRRQSTVSARYYDVNKKWLASTLVMTILAVFVVGLLRTPSASAQFTANNIIDDWLFDSVGTMNTPQIDAFLNNNFPKSCISTNNGFAAPDPIGYSPTTNFTYGSDVSAGRVINDAAQVYGLNPQVLLTTLEKEESLVSGNTGCSTLQYVSAMGNGCPDNLTLSNYSGFELYSLHGTPVTSVSGTCVNSPNKAGFSRQVISAAWLLKFGEQRSKGNINWAVINGSWDNSDDLKACYSGPMTQGTWHRCPNDTATYYDGYTPIDGTSVHMDTGATAALYWYTPHFHGNQLFDSIFESWFGGTTGEGYTLATSAADNGDLRQWVVYHGERHWVSPDIIAAWGLPSTPIQWAGTYLGSFPVGPDLGRLMRPTGTLDVYFVDGGHCFRVTSPDMLKAWNFSPGAIQDVSVGLGRVPANLGNLTYSVVGANNPAVFYVDGGSKRLYGSPAIQTAWEGSGRSHQTISDAYLQAMGQAADITTTKARYGSNYYMMYNGKAFMTVDQNIADAWGITGAMSMNVDISPEFVPRDMMTRFARSDIPGDGRLFAVDGGNLFYLSPEQANNLGMTAATPRMAVNPESITPTISAWSWIMVHDSSGKQYVIDGGTKHPFNPDGQVLSSWTNGGAVTSPQVTNGFLNQLPNNVNIEREIRGSGLQQYVVQGVTKRWVQSPSTAALYAPLQQVSDSLINALPNGANL